MHPQSRQAPQLPPRRRRRRLGLRAAVIGAAVMSVSGVAAANVLVENFMTADFSGAATACLTKTVGEDIASFPDGFAFDATTTDLVDNVNVTQESITITGVTGDRVVADEVYIITNNCAVALDVQIAQGTATGDWTGKHLEVWLGLPANVGTYPGAGDATWDQAPLEFNPATVDNAATGVVSIPIGGSVPVGMVVTTGADVVGTGTADWVVRSEAA